jgi:DNA modification methylase
MTELNRLGITLTDSNNLLIGGLMTEILNSPSFYTDGKTTITVHHSSQVCKFDFFHNQIIVQKPTGCKYFYDAAAIKEPHKRDWTNCGGSLSTKRHHEAHIGGSKRHLRPFPIPNENGANRRSVWTVPTAPFPGAHFATFPPKLIEPCILAGCPQGGTVLDPFGGSGTVGMVSESNGRNAILIELNPKYVDMARRRTAQQGLFGCTQAHGEAPG